MQEDAKRHHRNVGADILVRGSTASSVVSFSGAPIPQALVPAIEKQPHVVQALGVAVHNIDLPLVVTGLDLDRFNKFTGGFRYVAGGPFRGPDDVLVDSDYAAQKRVQPGDSLVLMNHPWHVAGIVDPGKLARIAVPLKTLQELDASTGHISAIYVKVDRPENIASVVQELETLLPSYKINSMDDFLKQYNVYEIPGVRPFTLVVVSIGVVIGFAVACLSMYMAVLQRTREIGILKSLGASNGFIVGIILVEAMFLGLGGTILGIIFSFGARWLIATLVPASIQMAIVYAWWPIACAIILAAAAFGALYPGLNAARHDPIEALAYE
jgi:putative ABC transport system permease protein